MGWKLDLVVYVILFLIFVLRKEKGKKVSMLISVIFASISCVTYLETTKLMLIPHIAIGLLSVVLLFFVERRHPITFKKTRSKAVSGLLSLFLGGFGIHGFYLGHWAWACLYLLFWWTYIPAIIGLVEAIIIFILPKQTFTKLYCLPWKTNASSKSTKENIETGENEDASPKDTFEYENVAYDELENEVEHDDVVEYNNISLHETQTLKFANIKGNIEKFTITVDTAYGPIHFLVENGIITAHYLESKRVCKQYEVN